MRAPHRALVAVAGRILTWGPTVPKRRHGLESGTRRVGLLVGHGTHQNILQHHDLSEACVARHLANGPICTTGGQATRASCRTTRSRDMSSPRTALVFAGRPHRREHTADMKTPARRNHRTKGDRERTLRSG